MLTFKKKGSSYVPESAHNLTFSCKIDTPMYEYNKKKYFNLELEDVTLISQTHDQCKKYLDDKKTPQKHINTSQPYINVSKTHIALKKKKHEFSGYVITRAI